jgi:RNA polymerase sigma-70 factor (ECF subfamily)
MVQEAFLRYHRSRQEGVAIDSPKAWLAAVVTRLAIDHLRSARVRRETYVGQWLPEPVVTEQSPSEDRLEMTGSLSMAFLVVLETLSPVERAVFLLREVFDYDYAEIAGIVEKSEDNCRQIFTRAKRRIDARKPRFEPSREKRDELAGRFFAACREGSLNDLVSLLAADATFYGDGGGKTAAVMRPVLGRDRVARLILGIFSKGKLIATRMAPAEVNGQPGAITFDDRDRIVSVFALEIVDGAVHAVRSVINPDKLRHLGPVSDLALLPPRSR